MKSPTLTKPLERRLDLPAKRVKTSRIMAFYQPACFHGFFNGLPGIALLNSARMPRCQTLAVFTTSSSSMSGWTEPATMSLTAHLLSHLPRGEGCSRSSGALGYRGRVTGRVPSPERQPAALAWDLVMRGSRHATTQQTQIPCQSRAGHSAWVLVRPPERAPPCMRVMYELDGSFKEALSWQHSRASGSLGETDHFTGAARTPRPALS